MLFGMWTSVGPRIHVLDGGPDPPCIRAILRERGQPIAKYRHLLHQSRCHLGIDSGGPSKRVTWGCTLVQPGKHEWTVHVRRRCGPFVKYSDHLSIYSEKNHASHYNCKQSREGVWTLTWPVSANLLISSAAETDSRNSAATSRSCNSSSASNHCVEQSLNLTLEVFTTYWLIERC